MLAVQALVRSFGAWSVSVKIDRTSENGAIFAYIVCSIKGDSPSRRNSEKSERHRIPLTVFLDLRVSASQKGTDRRFKLQSQWIQV